MDKYGKSEYKQWKRLLAIDKCLQNSRRPVTIEELRERCNDELYQEYSLRTYYNDIENLKDIFEAPIVCKKYPYGSYYLYSHEFSLKEIPVRSTEREAFEEALRQIVRFCTFSKSSNFNTTFYDLREMFGYEEDPGKVMGYDTIPNDLSGREYLTPLFENIIHHETLDLQYKVMNRDVKKITVFPYYLKQFNRRWFLIARKAGDGSEGRLMVYALDRILDYEVNLTVKYEESGFDFSTYFDNLYGVTIPENREIEKVIIRIDKKEYPYLESNPLNESQDIIDEDDAFVTFSLDVYINYELKQKLLSYGSKLEVMEPLSLRRWMAKETKKMAEAYVRESE